MFGYITRQAGSVAAPRRQPVTIDSASGTQPSNGGARQTVGLTLVAIGQRVAGEIPASRAPQPHGDCA